MVTPGPGVPLDEAGDHQIIERRRDRIGCESERACRLLGMCPLRRIVQMKKCLHVIQRRKMPIDQAADVRRNCVVSQFNREQVCHAVD